MGGKDGDLQRSRRPHMAGFRHPLLDSPTPRNLLSARPEWLGTTPGFHPGPQHSESELRAPLLRLWTYSNRTTFWEAFSSCRWGTQEEPGARSAAGPSNAAILPPADNWECTG